MDDDLTRHMPMVVERFGAHGTTGGTVTTIAGPPDRVMATLASGGVEAIEAALKADGGPVIGDVPDRSNRDAMPMVGNDVGHG